MPRIYKEFLAYGDEGGGGHTLYSVTQYLCTQLKKLLKVIFILNDFTLLVQVLTSFKKDFLWWAYIVAEIAKRLIKHPNRLIPMVNAIALQTVPSL